jgi:hypothetical protein
MFRQRSFCRSEIVHTYSCVLRRAGGTGRRPGTVIFKIAEIMVTSGDGRLSIGRPTACKTYGLFNQKDPARTSGSGRLRAQNLRSDACNLCPRLLLVY